MFNKWKKLKELSEEIDTLRDEIRLLKSNQISLVSGLANVRGIINRKLYSGKMKEDTPSWLEDNLSFFGIQKDKKDDVLGI